MLWADVHPVYLLDGTKVMKTQPIVVSVISCVLISPTRLQAPAPALGTEHWPTALGPQLFLNS